MLTGAAVVITISSVFLLQHQQSIVNILQVTCPVVKQSSPFSCLLCVLCVCVCVCVCACMCVCRQVGM